MPRGNGDGRRGLVVPAVTIRSPVRTILPRGTRSNRRSPPTAGATVPGSRDFAVTAETPKSWSVSSVTTALPEDTDFTRPTSPAPLRTGWSFLTPSEEPLLITTVEYQVLGERS